LFACSKLFSGRIVQTPTGGIAWEMVCTVKTCEIRNQKHNSQWSSV
jgi:hypothetical protein